MKISAIFSDYDGTLASEEVSLESSRVPEEIEEPLRELSSSVPVAIVTAKDYSFVRPRTDFASAWACVSGLEMVLSDGRAFATSNVSGRVRDGLNYVRGHDGLGLRLELKHSTRGDLLGFSVDWRGAHEVPSEFITTAISHLAKMDLKVVHNPPRPYFDVFGAKPDKGRAVRDLKRLLGVSGEVLFLGDSREDNPAFGEADVAICVAHGQSLESLTCVFAVRHEELSTFLRSLVDGRLSLDPSALSRR
jgi:hypothetical protein